MAEDHRPAGPDGTARAGRSERASASATARAGENTPPSSSDEATPDRATLAAELEECQARHLRTLADFDNVRRRVARDLERARAAERDRVLLEWLPVLDNIDLALAHAGADPVALLEGISGVRELALAALRRSGVTRVDEAAVPFDPVRHEVAAVFEPGTGPELPHGPRDHDGEARTGEARSGEADHDAPPPGTVLGVFRPGYLIDGRVLRPASVAVSAQEPSRGDQRD